MAAYQDLQIVEHGQETAHPKSVQFPASVVVKNG